MIRFGLTAAICSLSLLVYSQDFNHYTPLSSKGTLPEDFTQRTSEKVEADIQNEISKIDSYKAKKSKKEFLLESNYELENLLYSGRVLYGDKVTQYVNKVADKVLESDPKLRKELRFYCLNSTAVNAFATNQGMIFITTGLISELQNEAQLAFVISHEIVHYVHKHVIQSKIEMDAIIRGTEIRYSDEDELITRLSGYSRAIEMEADSTGFNIFKKTGYNLSAANTMFNVLQFERLPFDEIPFQYEALLEEDAILPQEFILPADSLIPIDFAEDQDDTHSSHPNIATRRSAVERFLNAANTTGGSDFLVSEEEFFLVRNLCRFEHIKNSIKELDYIEALYNIQVLQKEFPKSFYLQKATAKALYGIAKYKNANKYARNFTDFDEHEGQIGALYYFFENMTPLQSNLMALNYCWNIRSKFSDDEYLQSVCNDLLRDFHQYHKYSLEEIEGKLQYVLQAGSADSLVQAPDGTAEELSSTPETPESDIAAGTDLGKYEKLALMKKKVKEKERSLPNQTEISPEDQFFIYNLHNRMSEEEFLDSFKESLALYKKEESNKEEWDDYLHSLSYRRKHKYLDKLKKRSYNLSADKVVFVDPQFYSVNHRGVQLINSEKRQFNFYDQLNLTAKNANIEQVTLSPKINSGFTGEMLSDMGKFKQWIYEKGMHNEYIDDSPFICAENEYIKYLSDKYGTDYFAYTAIVSTKEKKEGKLWYVALGIYIFPILPYMLVKAFTPNYSSYYYTAVFNVNSGDIEFDRGYAFGFKVNKGNLNSAIYDNLNEMTKEKKAL